MKCIHKKAILVVDDDEAMLRALKKVLSGEGAAVTCAAWAGDAIEILAKRQQQFDLIITDLRMPLVTGMTLVYAIHKIFPELPVIVLTAFGAPHTEVACREQGAASFLEKPLDTAQLLAAIMDVFARQTPQAASVSPPSIPPSGHTTPQPADAKPPRDPPDFNACESPVLQLPSPQRVVGLFDFLLSNGNQTH